MLTRSRIQCGEGEIEEFDPENGPRRARMASPKGEDGASSILYEGEFLKDFMRMKTMVEEIDQVQKKGEQGGSSNIKGKGEGYGKDPPKTPPSSPYFIDGYFDSPSRKKKVDFNMPQLNLDIKFELPIYNGELNAKEMDNWIRKL